MQHANSNFKRNELGCRISPQRGEMFIARRLFIRPALRRSVTTDGLLAGWKHISLL
jgi:hypothetical protein